MAKYSWIIWYLFWGAISLFCLGLGVANFFQERAFLAQAELDTGTITQYELHVRHDGKSEYCPRIEFTDKAGEPVAVAGSDCPNAPDKSKVGQTVQVYYDPKNPNAYEEKTVTTGLDGLIFGLIGAIFFGLFWFVPTVAAVVRKLLPGRGGQPAYAPGASGLNDTMRQDAERYHANQLARERAEQRGHADHPHPPAAAPTDAQAAEEARLAQLEQQANALQHQIEVLRRQQGKK